jgi:tetratricopeptide (TPR) repeat protein
MSDPLRTDRSRAAEPASHADRDAKIEQLLLTGLDHYFAGQYDQAINVWTRALFLDRSHAKARAYIERARSAQAERQRESEALLHDGAAAIQRGDSSEARRLLREAMAHDGPSDEVLALLDRVARLEHGAVDTAADHRPDAPRLTLDAPPQERSRAGWIAIGVLTVVIVAAGVFAASAVGPEWSGLVERSSSPRQGLSPGSMQLGATELPPLPRRAQATLARARALMATGRLRDAAAQLATIPDTAPEKAEAERLRADIQRQLLAVGRLSGQQAAGADPIP